VSNVFRGFTVTASSVTPINFSTLPPTVGPDVDYSGVERLSVNAGGANNTFTVQSTAAGTTTTLNGGAGPDTFNVGNAADTFDDIKGPLVLNGNLVAESQVFFPDIVNLFNQGSTVTNSYVVRDNSVTRTGGVVVVYNRMDRLTLNAGTAADGVVVTSTTALTPVTLNMGGGDDVVNIGTRTGTSLDGIAAPVTVNGETGSDTILLNDQTDTNANNSSVTATNAPRNTLPILSYAPVENLTLNAGASGDAAAVQSTTAVTPVTLKMGGGDDVVTVGSTTNSLDAIRGQVTVDGQ